MQQGSNGSSTQVNTPVSWVSGILHSGNSHYVEGMTVPYRLVVSDLVPGQTYCLTIGWSTKSQGKHALDFLTSYDRNASHAYFNHAPEPIDPLAGTTLAGSGITPVRYAIPGPSSANSPVAGQPFNVFSQLASADRRMAIFNGTISSGRYVREDPLTANNAESHLEICFRVNEGQNTIVLAWGANIASRNPWGVGKTAVGENGAPYSMFLVGCSGLIGCGNRTLNLRADGLLNFLDCGITGPLRSCGNAEISFYGLDWSLGYNNTSNYVWRITNNQTGASIVGSNTQRTVRIQTGNATGTFDLEVSIEGLPYCSRTITVYNFDNVSLRPASLEWCRLDANASLSWSGLPALPEVGTFLSLVDEAGKVLGRGADLNALLPFLDGPGTYSVIGTAFNTIDTTCRQETPPVALNYKDELRAGFRADTVCLGQPTSFQDRTLTNNGVSQWQWTFGDGAVSTEANPAHRYASPGIFRVRLVVTTENGCSDTVEKDILVQASPRADFTAENFCAGQEVRFRQTASPGAPGAAVYEWQFGDGTGAFGAQVGHRYPQPGVYTAKLIVTNALGCRDSVEKNIQVYALPEAAFAAEDACLGSPVVFQQNSQTGGGALVSYRWQFGDGAQSTQAAPSHTYNQPGSYEVNLTVTDANGCVDSYSAPVSVFRPVTVAAGADASICWDAALQLNGSISGGATQGRWSDGDAGGVFTPNATTLNASYRPPAGFSGPLTLTLASADPQGPCPSVSDALILTVLAPPAVAFQADPVCLGQSTTFVNTSASPNGAITGQRWTFGDGKESTAANPTHRYEQPGTYSVTLAVVDAAGCAQSLTRTVVVHALPVADFDAAGACPDAVFTFTNRSQTGAGGNLQYQWQFGDGATSSEENPTHVFGTGGAYPVQLRVSDGNTCQATVTKTVTVRRAPRADFSANNVCNGETAQFTSSATSPDGTITAYEWQFGDGTTSQEANPVHTYAQAGGYQVRLTVRDDAGCSATFTRQVNVWSAPVVDFTVGTSCAGETTAFTHNARAGSAPLQSFLWAFGDGQTSTERNPQHRYAGPGSFTVNLTVTDENGCRSSGQRTVEVKPAPLAAFAAEAVCLGAPTVFRDQSTGDPAIVTWAWDFGDGMTGATASPQHTFGAPGTYRVRLTVTNELGCRHSIEREVVVHRPPQLSFTATNLCAGQEVVFVPTSAGAAIARYEWQFGDGAGSQLAEPRHAYPGSGAYRARLTATDVNGCSASVEKDVKVLARPQAAFDLREVCQNVPFTLRSASRPGDSPLTTYRWDLGNGQFSTLAEPTLTFGQAGVRRIRLTVTDQNGCSDQFEADITVLPGAEVEAGPDASLCAGESLALNGRVSGGATTGAWSDGGAGGVFSPNAQTLTATYSPPANFDGAITLTLTSADPTGPCAAGSDALTLRVRRLPVASFTAEAVCEGESVVFVNTSTPGTDPLTSVRWDFGDGQQSTASNPRHRYAQAGNYTATLTVTAGACSQSITKTVTVRSVPQADFSAEDVCLGQAAVFRDRSVAGTPITGWSWSFGDNQTATTQNPQHTYAAAGIYTVRLIVSNEFGCRDTIERQLRVQAPPKADFRVANQCLGEAVQFTSTSTTGDADIALYEWQFGDGFGSLLPDPTHTYAGAGAYPALLTVTDANGCSSVKEAAVRIFNRPKAGFELPDICQGSPIVFRQTTQAGDGAITAQQWDFGNGQQSSQAQPTVTFAQAGNFTVRLTVTDANGCSDSFTAAVTVRPAVVLEVGADLTICAGESTKLNGRISGGATSGTWSDGGAGGAFSPNANTLDAAYIPPAGFTGTVTLTLTSADPAGPCGPASASFRLTVNPAVTVEAGADATLCAGTPLSLQGRIGGGATSGAWSDGGRGGVFSPSATTLNATYTPAAGYTGTIILTLTSIDPAGPCGAKSDGLTLTINAPVIVSAGEDLTACIDGPVALRGAISGGVTNGVWSDGGAGGAFSPAATALNATYTPPAGFSGAITLTLTSADPAGPCGPQSDQLALTLRRPPTAAFQAEAVCDRQPVQFSNTSTAGTGAIRTVRWDFGDGSQSSDNQPSHVYSQPGTYRVTLTVTDDGGCSASITREVLVKERPVAAFTVNGSCPGQALSFTNQSSTGPGISYQWTFGDGAASTLKDPSHTYAASGSYTVRLQVSDATGCTTTMSREIAVRALPQAAFTAQPVCEGGKVTFVNTSSGSNAAITAYQWTFGDGAGSQQVNPTHTYSGAGVFNVTLSVTDNFGCSAQVTRPVTVYQAPKAAFTATGTCEKTAVSFTSTSTPGSAAISTYLWDFADGRTSNLPAPSHEFAGVGTYPVKLTVTDANGCKSTVEQPVVISAPPSASFRADPVCEGTRMTFTNESLPGGSAIDRYQWQFGDGGRSTEAAPSYQYARAGTYEVVLTVFDKNGCQASYIRSVTVLPAPTADFSARVDCNTRLAAFADLSLPNGGVISTYNWDFGDGGRSQQANPTHTYAAPGTYRVSLEVLNASGCRQRIERDLVVPRAPTAAFTVTAGCEADGADVQIVNQSLPAPGGSTSLSYLWIVRDDRGRELTRSQQTVPALDLPPGAYTIELTVSDGAECTGFLSRNVTVYPDPAISIRAAADRVCQGESTTLTATLSGGVNCGEVQWQISLSANGPWDIIPGASTATYNTRTDRAPGRYFYRASYRCGGANCTVAFSNAVTVDVGAGEANLGCVGRVNIPLRENCQVTILPDMVATGTFGFCFPYRAEDFVVIVYDGKYPNGFPDNIVETPGLFPYELKLKDGAVQGGGVFPPCWGEVSITDQTPPVVACPADVTGLIRSGTAYRPAFQASEAGGGERYHRLVCTDLNKVYNVERSWTDPDYVYYTGLPQASDACGAVTLVKVEDRLINPGCVANSIAFGSQINTQLVRTFTYRDASGNTRTCDQTIYFFRPRIQLSDCKVELDLCVFGDNADLKPADIKSAPYYFSGAGDTLLLLDFVCGMSVTYRDQLFPGSANCGKKVVRTWTFLDDCRSAGLSVDLIDLPVTAKGCTAGKPAWSGARLDFEQTLNVADLRAPVVACPPPPSGANAQVFSTGPFNCTAVINPPAPVVSGECQAWTWTFEVYGFVVNPLTKIPEYKLIGQAQNQVLAGVAPGDYDLIYEVADACGNKAKSGKCPIRVTDLINPTAICDGELNVSLGNGNGNGSGSGVAQVLAEDVSENSRDNCGAVELSVRRVIDAACLDEYVMRFIDPAKGFADLREQNNAPANRVDYFNGNALVITREGGVYWSYWDRAVFFSCCDVSPIEKKRIKVELRVTDQAGNANVCVSQVLVEDKLAPRCSVADEVILCTDLDFDPRDSAQVAARFGAPRDVVTVFENCGYTISERMIWTPATCGRGTIERIFTVTDNSGLSSSCTQTITIEEVTDYEVRLPGDAAEVVCGSPAGNYDLGFETFGCDLLAVNRDTIRFDPPEGACLRLMITYDVINWCEYSGTANTTPTRISRDIDNDNDLKEPTWLVVRYDSTLQAIVAKVYGADAAGRRLAVPSRVFKPGDAGYNPGFFRYTQFVDIVDRTAPSVAVETAEREFCAAGTNCTAPYTLTLRVTDDCPLTSPQLLDVKLRQGSPEGPEVAPNSGAYELTRSGNRYTVSGWLPIGKYFLLLRFTDGCGNISGETVEITVRDCTPPAPICKELLSADLLPIDSDGDGRIDAGEVTIPATAFIASNISDCSPFPDEPVRKVKYYLRRTAPLTIDDLTQQSMTFTCEDEGLVDVFVIALDAAGNFDYCQTRVFVNPGNDPNYCDIPVGEGLIGGMIHTEKNNPVEEVMVRLSGQASASVMTDVNGMYVFEQLEEGYDYTVAPSLNRDFVNGVTTFDLLLISKHILAEDRLDTPYQMIAADANNDKRITTFDLILLRKLILTLTSTIEGNTSWRFVEGKYQFPDTTNPWSRPFPEVININDLDLIYDNGDFVAVKVGDINGNARTRKFQEPEVRNSAGMFRLRTDDRQLRAGQEYTVAITAGELGQITGSQFTLNWDKSHLDLVDLRPGLMRTEEMGLFAEEGLLTTSWLNQAVVGQSSGKDSALFTLVFRARSDGRLRDVLTVNSRRTPAEAYDRAGRVLDVGLTFGELEAPAAAFRLYPPHPNPWQEYTIIGFDLPAAGPATIRIQDINGRTLHVASGQFRQGYNEVRLSRGQLPRGVLFCVVQSDGEVAAQRMVVE